MFCKQGFWEVHAIFVNVLDMGVHQCCCCDVGHVLMKTSSIDRERWECYPAYFALRVES